MWETITFAISKDIIIIFHKFDDSIEDVVSRRLILWLLKMINFFPTKKKFLLFSTNKSLP